MPNIESKKGQGCPYKSITCQEGYCQDCQAYLNFRDQCAYLDYKHEKPLRAKLRAATITTLQTRPSNHNPIALGTK
jgi:hypothetical protein